MMLCTYDAENRLVKTCGNTGVGEEYAYDNNGNLLSQTSSLKHSIYEYNPQNRMVRARVVDDEVRTIASTRYGYDPLGRRTLVQDNGITTLRTLYDGVSFDVVKESPVYANGGFVDTYNTGIQHTPAGYATGERYRYLDDGQGTSEKYQYIEDNDYHTVSSRYTGERIMFYANGSLVAVNRSSGTRGYLGTDILGSTRSVTDNHGVQESYYDYDIFGSPVAGDFTTGADYGYLGKPYDSITGLYNYGYRDYSPQVVRFTTVDPIRDGANWFAYVNNDPVNYVDLWGLLASDGQRLTTVIPHEKTDWINVSAGNKGDDLKAIYLSAGTDTRIDKGQYNINAEAGIATIEGSTPQGSLGDFVKVSATGKISGVSGSAYMGVSGSSFGAEVDASLLSFKGTVNFTIGRYTLKIGGGLYVGGVALGASVGTKIGVKIAAGIGAEGFVSLEKEEKK